MRTWIKFCGTTSLEDALASIEAGADALGFIFAPSKRRVTMEQAREIISKLPAEVEKVGVFLDAPIAEVCDTIGRVELTGIQLHDSRNAGAIYDSLPSERRRSVRVIKTIVMKDEESRLSALFLLRSMGADTWLLDAGAGSGKTFDWRAARKKIGDWQGRLIIAGGLTPENVGEAIRIFSPWGVDVASGIEREPGRKDLAKMKAFVAAVRKAERK